MVTRWRWQRHLLRTPPLKWARPGRPATSVRWPDETKGQWARTARTGTTSETCTTALICYCCLTVDYLCPVLNKLCTVTVLESWRIRLTYSTICTVNSKSLFIDKCFQSKHWFLWSKNPFTETLQGFLKLELNLCRNDKHHSYNDAFTKFSKVWQNIIKQQGLLIILSHDGCHNNWRSLTSYKLENCTVLLGKVSSCFNSLKSNRSVHIIFLC